MSEQERISQLSALFDGELPREQAEMVIRRALRDPALRATWSRYALIGACVRGEPLATALPQVDLAARVRTRLASEPEPTSAGDGLAGNAAARASGASLWRRGAMGGAIAASVALVALVLVRFVAPGSGVPAELTAQQVTQRPAAVSADPQVTAPASRLVARESAPRSYTTPVDDSPARRGPLFNYVAAHSDVAVSAVRLAPLSSVMGGGFDLTQDAVEMSAAEVGARR
jgi:sigma-E factor negative regulatory protein RseA